VGGGAAVGFLAWVCVPLLRINSIGVTRLSNVLICLNVGLLWILALTLILLRRRQGNSNERVVDGLWLRSRAVEKGRSAARSGYGQFRSPTLAAINALPGRCRGPVSSEDQNRLETFFSGSWGWFALLVLVSFLAPWVEELFFRGLLLPRMRRCSEGSTGSSTDHLWPHHLHQPWSMPPAFSTGR
jgi:membrane protease YdiL (CAAX protease family)